MYKIVGKIQNHILHFHQYPEDGIRIRLLFERSYAESFSDGGMRSARCRSGLHERYCCWDWA